MKTLRVLYHMARADFLERTRRYSFLITLGLVLFLGYSIASGRLVLVIGPSYRGILNSAWVGGLMAMMINLFLGWFGFYLVKGSVSRDYETGVGQIMATTPLKRLLYTFGKWISNFSVLAVMVVILMASAVIMQLVYREDPVINLWLLFSPFLLIALPFLALVAALAVLFETVGWLRGGLGNAIYFFTYLVTLVLGWMGYTLVGHPAFDFSGMFLLDASMETAARAFYPGFESGFDITWIVPGFKTFPWYGMVWTMELVLSRLVPVFTAIGITALAALFFDRFNPSHHLRIRRKRPVSQPIESIPSNESKPVMNVHLTPLTASHTHSRFISLFLAEMKLFLKGQRWWWYAISLGLLVAQIFVQLETTRNLLVAAWVWPILILSRLGCRENRFDTRQLVFSAPRPIVNQLPAMWLSAFVFLAVMGSGALLRFLIAGETISILGWLTGVLFIPSLALACGVLTGSNKAFEVLYVLWMYMIIQKVSPFDFIGMTTASPLYIYIPLAFVLMVVAIITRQVQLKKG
jgi:hypothetical protein